MGTSPINSCEYIKKRDHPHAYGDKSDFDSDVSDGQGSSPRVWGQEDYDFIGRRKSGIIPTRMGTSLCQILP